MEKYSVDIEKLVESKLERLIGVINGGKSWLEVKKYMTLVKFSMDSLLKNNSGSFDQNNEVYKSFMNSFPKNMSSISYDDLTSFAKSINDMVADNKYEFSLIDWRAITYLEGQVEFDIKYEAIESSLLSDLFKLDVMDFNENLHILESISATMEGAYIDILQSNIKDDKSYLVLTMLSKLYSELEYDKLHKDDLIDSNVMDSIVVSLNAYHNKFHGLVNSYLRNDHDRNSHLAQSLKLSDQILKVLKDNDLDCRLLGLDLNDKSSSSKLLRISTIKLY